MITCREATRRASRALDAPLPLGECLALGLHLAACRGCARYAGWIRALHRALAPGAARREHPGALAGATLSDTDRARLRARVLEAASEP